MLSIFTKMNYGIEERHHGPSDAPHNPSYSHSSFSQKRLVSFVTEIHMTSIDFLTLRSYDVRWKPCQGDSFELNLPDHRYQDKDYQGRWLASFLDDAKYEHVGQDTRSQGGNDDKDKQEKDLKISELKTKSKDNDKGSISKIT
ncbi:hypothetical protein Tco_1412504 [Tanacetum coccineum]